MASKKDTKKKLATVETAAIMAMALAPEKALNLGFVKLDGDPVPISGKEYQVVSAGDAYLASLDYPKDTEFKRLNLDLYKFFVDDLPDFTHNNEGLLKITVNTRDPQNIDASPSDAAIATEFKAKDGQYSPSFLYKGVFRNILFREWLNLRFDLYELDTDAEVYYDKVKAVIDGVPEIKNLDVLKGIPYLNVATQLFGSIIKTFGANPDDHVWGEIPILELEPTPGGAFLRSGIYILFESLNSKGEPVSYNNIVYKNELLVKKGNAIKTLSNHLIFGVAIKRHQQP